MCVPGCQQAMQRVLSRRAVMTGTTAFLASAVAPATVNAAPKRAASVIDLTHTMSPEFPTFEGTPGVELTRLKTIKADGYNLLRWSLNEHSGTHLDAPIHFSEQGITAAQIPAERLVARLAVVDIAAKARQNPDYQVSRADIENWERRHGRLPQNCCVAMHSGWARYVEDAGRYSGKDAAGGLHFPGFGVDAAEWLLKERRVVGIAVDTLSLDPGASKDFKTHVTWLSAGRWGLENVANLDRVPARGATMIVGLAKVKDATGGPARLIALV
jgi:kynurenine formamidase